MFRVGDRGLLRVTAWARFPWLVHGFSTRATGDFLDWPADEEVAAVFGAFGFGTATLKQVHSGRFVRTEGPWGANRPEADAVITSRPGVLIGVRTADCFPILLVDPVTRSLAAVHAGWRGTALAVLTNAIRGLVDEFGAKPANVEAAIGPGIGSCCFEVGEEVARVFSHRFVEPRRARPHVNLAAALEDQLARSGVTSVTSCCRCTSCDLGQYFSHRGEGGRTGRMLAAIGLVA